MYDIIVLENLRFRPSSLACEQVLQRALAAGRKKEGELATTILELEFHLQFPCGTPLTELSNFRQSARSGNERECKQPLKNTCQGKWRHSLCHLRQSAFRIDFFDADIRIPEK